MNQGAKKLGVIVNPVAGIGGKVGLKGSDGEAVVRRARALGGAPASPGRAVRMLKTLTQAATPPHVITYPREMGGDEAEAVGLHATVVGEITSGKTSREDTVKAARMMKELGAEMILFVGGDGTARDILDAVDGDLPVLGVPAGVKVYSAVFAVTPEAAGDLALRFLEGGVPVRDGEVMDVDEDVFRSGVLSAKLYGYLRTPYEPTLLQSSKEASLAVDEERCNQDAVAKHLAEEMKGPVTYVAGPGTTLKALFDRLGLEKTLLGVDVIRGGRVVVKDAGEEAILKCLEEGEARIIVTPLGGQGFIFGRGNQPISPQVIRRVGREGIIVAATHSKLRCLRALYVDTGDEEVDGMLRGYIRVVVDYRETQVVKVL